MDLNVLGNYNSSICLALRSGNRFASLALSIATSEGGREVARWQGATLCCCTVICYVFGKYEFCSTCAYFSFSISHHVERKAQREWPEEAATLLKTLKSDGTDEN